MKKQLSKLISLILVAALLVQIIPMSVFATEPEEIYVEELGDLSADSGEDSPPAQILFEEESLREENVKHFRLDDGSYIAVQYDTPVHYQDANGEWVDYDNTLSSVSSLDGSGVSCYRVENGDSIRVFAVDANAEVLLAVRKGDYSLSLTPMDEPDAEIPVDPNQPVVASAMEEVVLSPATVLEISSDGAEDFDDPLLAQAQPEKIYSALEYTDVINGADIRYENYANTIKESIVIPEAQAEYVYSFRMETEGLTPTLQEDGSILLQAADGSVVYSIPAPYMIDANNEYSYEAEYTLTEAGDAWILTVTADAAWMNAEERAFPVLLDPTVVEPSSADWGICATYVRSGYASSPDSVKTGLYVGNNGNSNANTRSYFHINNLISLPLGSEIYCAGIGLYHFAHETQSGGGDLDVALYAMEKINGSTTNTMSDNEWSSFLSGLTWNAVDAPTDPNYHDADCITDKKTLGNATKNTYVTWDITTLVHAWYESDEDNLGFALIPAGGDNTLSRASFYSPSHATNRPMMMVGYRNTAGVESYYTYQMLSAGRAGTSYISDYTMQNTVIVPLIASGSNVMPFELAWVYNTTYASCNFEASANGLHTKDFSKMRVGVGAKLSAQQTVVPLTINNETYLVYNDADGTEHYFAKKEGSDTVYEDEDGLDLEITVSGTDYTMSNDDDYTWFFDDGYLKWECDAYLNYIRYQYDTSGRLKTITRQNNNETETIIETLASLNYDTSTNRLVSVTDEAGRVTEFEYVTINASAYLQTIAYPDGHNASYSYASSNGRDDVVRMTRMTDEEIDYSLAFTYSYNTDVRNVCEYSGEVMGAAMHGYRRSPYQSVYRYYGDDQIAAGVGAQADDFLVFKVFDRAGRTINSYTTDSTEKHVLGVGAASYTANSETKRENNRVLSAASAGQQGVNLLKNADLEYSDTTAEAWTRSTTYARVGTTAYHGDTAMLFTRTSAVSTADRWRQTVLAQDGGSYTFSAYVNVSSGVTFSSGGYLQLRILLSNNTVCAVSEKVTYSTENINDGWMRISATATNIPANTSIIADVYAVKYKGDIFVDSLQLEHENAPSTYNLLDDASFEHLSSLSTSAAYGWYRSGAATVSTTNDSYFGDQMITLSGSGLHRVLQTVSLNVPVDTTFLLSGWAKGAAIPSSVLDWRRIDSPEVVTPENSDSIPEVDPDTDPFFGLAIRLNYSDGSVQVKHLPYDPTYHGWQYVQEAIVSNKTDEDLTITSVTVLAAYDNNINTACFDHISLRMEPVQTYTYNDNGDAESVTQTGTGTENAAYTGKDLTTYTAPNGVETNFDYNDQHDILTAITAGVTTTYTYDNSGNALTAVRSANGTSKTIRSSVEISADRNDTEKIIDTAGNVTKLDYNDSYGFLDSSTDANNTKTVYLYTNENGRPRMTYIDSVASVQYTYVNGRQTQLARQSKYSGSSLMQYYNFTYNDWGQRTSVSVGTRNLVSYEYENINATAQNGGGLRTKETYGNQDYAEFTYDDLDRLVRTDYNSGRYITYAYNAEGALAKQTYGDGTTEKGSYVFEYDSLGRLIRSNEFDGSGAIVQRTEQIYDEYGRPSSQNWSLGTNKYSESYTYNDPTSSNTSGDGMLSSVTTATGDTVSFDYDALKRVEEKTVSNDAGTLFYTTYSYRDINSTKTTNQVAYHAVRSTSSGIVTSNRYTYDTRGNISMIYEGEYSDAVPRHRPLVAYTYDKLNQLTVERHYVYNSIYSATADGYIDYVYNYDTAGNLRSEKKRTLDAEENLLSEEVTKSYTYGNTQWRDLLTKVGTTSLTYDNIGNPLTYYNGEKSYTGLTWENGRQLTSITTGGNTTTYAYDADGIRTQKIVNGETHAYITQNGKVVRETIGIGTRAQILTIIYDNAGNPFALEKGRMMMPTEVYYYVLNLQGDVVGLLDDDGALVAQYSYNVWGELLSVTDANGAAITSATHVANLNPIRYRGYYYDTETGFYYLQSRYYDPANRRFINADSYYDTGTGFLGYNMFAYCNNNPVMNYDPKGEGIADVISEFLDSLIEYVISWALIMLAPDLDINTASDSSYDCLGNGVMKQTVVNLPGYQKGDSTETTYSLLVKLVGAENIRRLDSIDDPIAENEFKVALKCGPSDYHFIRLDDFAWFNKSGKAHGLYVSQEIVVADTWYAMWVQDGVAYKGDPKSGFPYYDDATIYFALKKGWSIKQ